MILAKCITWGSRKQLLILTCHMHYCPLNIVAIKQMTIFCVAIAPKQNDLLTISILGSKKFQKPFHWIQIQTLYIFIQLWHNKILINSHLHKCCVGLRGGCNNNSPSLAPELYDEALSFTLIPQREKSLKSMPQSTIVEEIPDM